MNPECFGKFVSEFMQESERAAIVLGAAQIDDLLTEILKKRLIQPASELFDFNGPFGTFSSKIHALCTTGVIDSEFASKIHIVRKIRNECAHNIQSVDLNGQTLSQRIKELCSSFVNKNFWDATKQEAEKTFGVKGNALDLRLSIAFLIANLAQINNYIKPIDESNIFKIIIPENKT